MKGEGVDQKMNIRVTLIMVCTSPIFFSSCRRDEPVSGPWPVISGDIPFDKNPSRYWQVGYSLHKVLSPADFRLCTFADTSNVVGMWHPSQGRPGYYPYTGQNRTTTLQSDPTNSWSARPGQIVMEGSNTGQFSMLRFIAPVSGEYKLSAVFEGVHRRLSTTDVHILLNDRHLFDDIIDGYGGDPSFFAITGGHPVSSYTETLRLNKNDVLTFAVGYGPNKSHFNDTTGLMLSIKAIPPG